MRFERKIDLERLISAEKLDMIKIITGMRRCGKSFLLFELYKQNLLDRGIPEDHIIEVNLEDRMYKKLRDPDNCLEYIHQHVIDKEPHYLLIDEVQLMNEFEDVLNSCLHIKNLNTFVTGSNSKFLSKDVITEFRGRGWEIRIHPLSFADYFEVVGGESLRALNDYYLYGGLPGVMQCESAEEKENYLREVFETVYVRDVVDRNHLRNPDGLRELVRILASAMGSSMNVRKIANTFKSGSGMDIGPQTISRYLEHLQDSFLIGEALRYDVKGRKYIGTETKYYFEDVGIRNAIIGFRQVEFNHTMENVVWSELCRQGYTVDVGLVETFKRDAEGKIMRVNLEVDFVVNKHDQRLYVQSAYMMPDREKVEQEQASLLNISDAFRKIIIDGGRYHSNYNDNGVLIIGIFDFLLNPTAIDRK